MTINYGRDKTEELKKKGILVKEKVTDTQYNMKEETENIINTPPAYHSFLKTKG
jgi:hypothetical protein